MNRYRRVRGRVKSDSVHRYLKNKVSYNEKIHLTLIDPDKVTSFEELERIADELFSAGTDAFLVGGSVGVSERDVDEVVKALKKFNLPVILFPGNISGLSREADALLFMSLLNSDDPYFIVGAAVLGAPIVLRYELEALPTAYIIVGYGGAAGYVGRARPIPYEKPELGAAYVLAAKYLGMKYVYLEAGSGAPEPIPQEFIFTSSKVKGDAVLIVGGGIRTPDQALNAVKAGADAIVTGTVIEKNPKQATEIVKAVKKYSRKH
ncbi:MAG: geranylgeranylglyceryl/heptaprenylglyceryl phosphate synthase [Desulfurococcales archaeon]|nr:geranylgeranylglyceryl/heptaprenylglyceryl phosphate synthase [Desulfurococcales archaeon]